MNALATRPPPRKIPARALGATALRPLAAESRDTKVLGAISDYIRGANIQPGDRLPPERELVARLRVSRSTVREALKRWEGLGIVETRRGSGTYLRTSVDPDAVLVSFTLRFQRESLLRTLELRRALELEAVALAAMRASPEILDEIEHWLTGIETISAKYGPGAAGREDWEFHLAIYRATQNPMFGQIIASMHDATHKFYEQPFGKQDFAWRTVRHHRGLFEAIRNGDARRARGKVLQILSIVEEDVIEASRNA